MDEDYYQSGQFRGRKDSEGRIYDENMNIVGFDNGDGTYIDFRTGSIWMKFNRK